MNNPLAKQFTTGSLLLFALPNIIMMMFLSLYTVVDGMFVSKFVGTDALSAVNIVYPLVSIQLALAIMLATGGSAVIANKMGAGKSTEARQDFSFLVLVSVLISLVISILGGLFLTPILKALGASNAILGLCYDYAFILLFFAPAFFMQTMFQYFFVTAGKPSIGLAVTLAGGFANIILDYVFIVPMQLGVKGAAYATGIGYCIPAIYGLFYFAIKKSGTLSFVRPVANRRVLLSSCWNGSSEMVTNLATAITTYLFNITMMRHLGEDGVASITILLYSQFLFTSIYLGYSAGIAPAISYNHGSGNLLQLKKLFRISIIFLCVCSLLSFGLAILFASTIAGFFTTPGSNVYAITVEGFSYFSIGFLFMGINIFASALFTALSDGRVSALLSFMRTFVFITACILLLPLILDIKGIWLSIPVAELLGLGLSVFYFNRMKYVYGYL